MMSPQGCWWPGPGRAGWTLGCMAAVMRRKAAVARRMSPMLITASSAGTEMVRNPAAAAVDIR